MRNFIALVACLSLTAADAVQDSDSLLCTASEHNATELLTRRRRYLVFEKGSAVTIALSSVKTIIAGIPRGMMVLNEQTVYYALPSSLSQLNPLPPTQPPTQPPTKPPSTRLTDWKSWSVPHHAYVSPGYTHTRYMHERSADREKGLFDVQDIAEIFFQQIRQFADSYGYNARHCILRTICDARHFLYPEGQSLFHDAIRILLETYMSRGFVDDQKQIAAWRVRNSMDCANLYGPHCRISFLDHFTAQIYGKFV